MAEPAPRVALLARPGIARERLQAALHEAGAEVVLVADPTEADADGVRAAGAQAILIALDPAVEDALDRFDAVLADPGMTVIFDEAELAVQREGWEAARWVRHLAAKLGRHDDVLPPGAEIESAMALEPGRLNLYQRPEGDGDITAFAGEADSLAATVPRDRGVDAAPRPAEPSGTEYAMAEPEELPAAGHPVDDPAVSDRFQSDLDALHLRIASMELVNDRLT
ncbi:MAG: hypothetical protein ABIO58_02535, partial [Luteimonas sp.]